MQSILVLFALAAFVAAIPIQRDLAIADGMSKREAVKPIQDLEAVNSGWTVDGNNSGWTVEGDNFNCRPPIKSIGEMFSLTYRNC
ncbi:hypothetical protein B0H13DRAFT_1954220 [Mycena leptocephala]|nr:hypothetical protein B0H13DRAFT_1954220 [Mycena leptocephala]